MSIDITEVEKNKLLSKKAIGLLPKVCRCGHKLEFSDSLRKLVCTNKKCSNLVLDRCRTFCNRLSLGLSENELINIVNKLNIVTPYQLLMLDGVYENGIINEQDIQNIKDIIQKLKIVKSYEYFMYQIIEMSGISEVDKVAKKIFYGFNSTDEIFDEIESSRVIFFNERLGIRSSDSTIISVEIYNKIMDLREELIFAESQLTVKKHQNVLRIAFADSNIGKFINKGELIEYIEDKYGYTVLHTSSISNNTDILIKSGSGSSTKARIARTINEKFIADKINDGTLDINDIGKVEHNKLKPVGSVIYIDTLEHVLDRFNSLAGAD